MTDQIVEPEVVEDESIEKFVEEIISTRAEITGESEPNREDAKIISQNVGNDITTLEVSGVVQKLKAYKQSIDDVHKDVSNYVEKYKGEQFDVIYEPQVVEEEQKVRTWRTLWGLLGTETDMVKVTRNVEKKVKKDVAYGVDDLTDMVDNYCEILDGIGKEMSTLDTQISEKVDEMSNNIKSGATEMNQAYIAYKNADKTRNDLGDLQSKVADKYNQTGWETNGKDILDHKLLDIKNDIVKAQYDHIDNGDTFRSTDNFRKYLSKLQSMMLMQQHENRSWINKNKNTTRNLTAMAKVGGNAYKVATLIAQSCENTAYAVQHTAKVVLVTDQLIQKTITNDNWFDIDAPLGDLKKLEESNKERYGQIEDRSDRIDKEVKIIEETKYEV